jgi:tetratricopeptide (TPR) repeat protein
VESIQEQPPPTAQSSPTKGLDQSDPWDLYIYALKAPATKTKYCQRLRAFLDFSGYEESSLEDKARAFAAKARTDSNNYAFNSLRRFFQMQRERVERKEIAIGTVRNYAKAIKLFYEMADLNVAWQKIMRGLPRGRRYADDRAPTLQEIRRITDYPDRRIKPIVYMMASSGIRVGAWDYLFSLYYYKLLTETSHTIGKKDHVLSIERFNVIWQGKDNDFDRAIRLAKDRWMASYSSSFLGSILRMLGRYNVAPEHHKIALSIDEELNDKIAMAKDYNNIGLVLHYQGNFDLALQYYKKALEENEKLQNRDGIAEAYVNIAIILGGVHHNFGQALGYLKKALSIYEDLQERLRSAELTAVLVVRFFMRHLDNFLTINKK